VAHKIVHWELMGPDGDALAGFYRALFGWDSEAVPGFDRYNMVDGETAGIGGAVGQGPDAMPNYMTFYVEVASIDEHLAKVEAAGGSTVMARTVIPGTVTFGMFSDPAGNMVGLVESETPPAE